MERPEPETPEDREEHERWLEQIHRETLPEYERWLEKVSKNSSPRKVINKEAISR